MTKSELIHEVAMHTGITKKDTKQVIDVAVGVIRTALAEGQRVQIDGLGTFKLVQREARSGHNPRTGESITIPARRALKFVAVPSLKEAVR